MHTLLQTQLDISEMASRMYAELVAYILGLVEPAFPLASGEYSLTTSLALVVALIAGVLVSGGIRDWLDKKVDARKSYSSEPVSEATADIPEDFLRAYHKVAAQEAAPGRAPTIQSATVSTGAQSAPAAGIPVRLAALVSRVIAGLAYFAILSYLAASAVLFMARLLVGGG